MAGGASENTWRRCSSCKEFISFASVYWVCSVSTCNRKRTGLVFCKTDCWDAHLGLVHHRESWALEKRAPTRAEAEAASVAESTTPAPSARSTPRATPPPSGESAREPRRVVVSSRADAGDLESDGLPRDILIVASKLKAYVRARSGMNTSDRVMDALSDEVRKLADRAIRNAHRAERKTVLDRDVE